MKLYVLKISIILFVVVTGGLLYLHKDVSRKSYYVTSAECKNCHQSRYESWNKTMHPKMFKPVETPDDILGDFNSADPALTFTKEDIEYVVGSKWEQVYARMIDGEYYPFPAKWYVIKKKWVPYKVNTWKKTPMSKKCNGCHTTGFNPVTLEFAEFGIGCEACHGPGSTHVKNTRQASLALCGLCHKKEQRYENDIIATVNSSVCGQCHNRGVNTSNDRVQEAEFNFPVNFTPGDNIDNSFIQANVEDDPKKQYWWGNGLSKNRHQEYADWVNSKHSQALRLLLENHPSNTDRGELTDECLKCHATDYRLAEEGAKPTIESARHGVTCVACHEPHGFGEAAAFSKDGTTTCAGCHIDSMSLTSAQKGKPHYPCPSGKAACTDCHMPYIIKTGGFFGLRSHAFKIIPPASTLEPDMPNSCQNGNCHINKSLEWAMDAFKKYYP